MKCFAFIFIAVFVLGQSHGGVIDATKAVLVDSENTKDQLKAAAPVLGLVNSADGNRDKRQLFGLPFLGLGASQSQASASAQTGSGSGSGSVASSNSKVSSIGAGIAGINLLHLSSSSSNAQSYSQQ